MLIRVLRDSESFNIGPWIKFGEIGRFGPSIFHNYKIGPCFTTTTNPKQIQPDPHHLAQAST
jgi:hypothetical protein